MRLLFGSFMAALLLVGGIGSVGVVCVGFAVSGLPMWEGVVLSLVVVLIACTALWRYIRPAKINTPPPPVVHPRRTALD